MIAVSLGLAAMTEKSIYHIKCLAMVMTDKKLETQPDTLLILLKAAHLNLPLSKALC